MFDKNSQLISDLGTIDGSNTNDVPPIYSKSNMLNFTK
jgi:hypothetical protein